MIKGALFDIDDTLFSHKIHRVPEKTILLLDELREKGIRTGICTSRVTAEMDSIPDELWKRIDCKIMGTGSTTMVEDHYYKSYAIDEDSMKRYMDYFRKRGIDYSYNDINGSLFYFGDLSRIEKGQILGLATGKVMIKEYEDEEVSNIFYYGASREEEEYIEQINPKAIISKWGDCGNISASHVDKSFGLLKFCQVYGFTTDEIAAAGDGGNDDVMLEMAGIGIAVSNAKQNTKASADYICKKSIEEGGLYDAFKELGII